MGITIAFHEHIQKGYVNGALKNNPVDTWYVA